MDESGITCKSVVAGAARSRTVPLVLHRVVEGEASTFEDIGRVTLMSIIEHVSSDWITFQKGGQSGRSSQWKWLLTFDDGWASDYEIVFPALLKAGTRAVFFPITGKVGTPGYISWEQAREMQRHGMEFGSHGVVHARMTALCERDVRSEFVASREALEDRLGIEVKSFAFPYGYYNGRLLEEANEAGYDTCCTSDHGTVSMPAGLVPRNSVNGAMAWSTILRTLEPSFVMRVGWKIEDAIKRRGKRILGEKGYKVVRRLVCNRTWKRDRD